MIKQSLKPKRGRPKDPIQKTSISIRLEFHLVSILMTNPNWREDIAQLIRQHLHTRA